MSLAMTSSPLKTFFIKDTNQTALDRNLMMRQHEAMEIL